MMINLDDFFKLPDKVQHLFVTIFRAVLDAAIYCGTHFEVFDETMTREQFYVISEIVRRYDNGNCDSSELFR